MYFLSDYYMYICTRWFLCFTPPYTAYVEILRGCQSWFESYISLLPLIPHLNWLGVLTPEEQDTLINTEHSEQSRIRGLLEMIVQKGAEGYRQFIEAVHREETHIGHRSLLTCIDNIRRGECECVCSPEVGLHESDMLNPLSTDGHYSGHLAKLRSCKFNSCTFITLILKNLHHWFVFISNFRIYQVFSEPCISQCIVFNWKALMLVSPHFS